MDKGLSLQDVTIMKGSTPLLSVSHDIFAHRHIFFVRLDYDRFNWGLFIQCDVFNNFILCFDCHNGFVLFCFVLFCFP